MKLITKNQQPVSNWSGGTTRQIFIYPEGSDYASRQFDFRISSATVDCESSTFTPLPGVHRHLMILEGSLELIHLDRYKKTLEVLEQDEFEGDWQTLSFGKVVDFNLMLKKGSGKIWGVNNLPQGPFFSKEQQLAMATSAMPFFYLHQGELQLGKFLLCAGDFIIGEELLEIEVSKPLAQLVGVQGAIFMD